MVNFITKNIPDLCTYVAESFCTGEYFELMATSSIVLMDTIIVCHTF